MPEKKQIKNKRSDGRFCVRISIEDEAGRKKQKSFYGKTQKEAKEKARVFQQELERGLDANKQGVTVEAWLAKWVPLATNGKSKSTYDTYYNACSQIVAALGQKKLRDVKEYHLQEYLNGLSGYSKSHISKARMVVRASFASAERNGLIPKNPALYLDTPKGTYVGHRALTEWEHDAILTHWRVRRAGFWVALMLLTGMRRGEACALKMSDYDEETGYIYVSEAVHAENNRMVSSGTTKTEAGIREIPVVEPLKSIIREYLDSGEHTYFLEDAQGRPLSKSALGRGMESFLSALEKIRNDINPDVRIQGNKMSDNWQRVHFTPHDLRYTYATMLYDAGVDEKTAQLWMGHTSSKMTRDLYAQLSVERERRSTEALEKHMERFKKE